VKKETSHNVTINVLTQDNLWKSWTDITTVALEEEIPTNGVLFIIFIVFIVFQASIVDEKETHQKRKYGY